VTGMALTIDTSGIDHELGDPRAVAIDLLSEVSARLRRTLDGDLRALCDLPLSWFEVLTHVAAAEGGCVAMSDLAAQISMTSSGVTRIADRMSAAGLLARGPCPDDGRVTLVQLTDAGSRRLAAAIPLHQQALEHALVEPLGGADNLAALTSLLRALRAG